MLRTADAVAELGRPRLRHLIASGRWQRPWRGVVVTHNAPLSSHERVEARLMACPPRSALGGATALALDGLVGFETERTFVILPEGARRPTVDGLTTHWSILLDERDVHPLRRPRRTRVERSLIDFASWSPSDRYARAGVLAAFQQRLVNGPAMHAALDVRGEVLRSGLVRESVLDAVGGIQSLPEADFDDLVLVSGLPSPSRQHAVQGPDGRYYLDVDWDEFGVAVEVHGLPHHGVAQWSADLVRANEVVIAGPRLLLFTSYVIRHEPGVVLDQLVRALRAGGWRGIVRPVSPRTARRPRSRTTRADASRS
ncbi:MAG: hypothetical protein PGN07_01560 [Aeromicrobium erythreum]